MLRSKEIAVATTLTAVFGLGVTACGQSHEASQSSSQQGSVCTPAGLPRVAQGKGAHEFWLNDSNANCISSGYILHLYNAAQPYDKKLQEELDPDLAFLIVCTNLDQKPENVFVRGVSPLSNGNRHDVSGTINLSTDAVAELSTSSFGLPACSADKQPDF